MTEHLVYIGIGSNRGDPASHVKKAIFLFGTIPETRLNRYSSLYLSAPVDADGNDYVNAVVSITTSLSPEKLLRVLQQIEKDSGRERTYRHAPRTLDLDILLYDDIQLEKDNLLVPHPRMHERAFVLVPLLEIAPDIIIPGKGQALHFLHNVNDQAISVLDT